HEVAEDILEDIGHRGTEFRPESARTASTAALEGGMAEPVVGRPLLRVLQRVIRLGNFLELVLGLDTAGIAVRVELHGELAVGALERRLVGPLGDAENLVEITFGQSGYCPIARRRGAGRRKSAPQIGIAVCSYH